MAATLPLERYAEYLFSRGLRDQTVRNYVAKLRFAWEWASSHDCDLRNPAPSALRSMADELPDTHSSRRHLRTALTYFWRMEHCDLGFAEAIVVPHIPPPLPKSLTDNEADALAYEARRMWPEGAVVMLGLYAGFRRAEIAWAKWEWWTKRRWEWVTILGKGGRTRHVPVHPDLRSWLRPRTGHGYMFPGGAGRSYVSVTTINNWFNMVADRAGVDATPHQLRHTFAQTLYRQTRDIHLVQTLLGHADIKTTMVYVAAGDDEKVDAVHHMRSFGGPSRLHVVK